MQSVKVRLRKKRRKGWEYREIEIPTDAEMERVAAELHTKHVPALTSCFGWKVFYNVAKRVTYSVTPVNPFTGERGQTLQRQSRAPIISYCVFGYGAEWQVCYSWNRGDNEPPVRIQEKGDVVPLPAESQENLFSESRGLLVGTDDSDMFFEGAIKRAELSMYERSREARKQCIGHYGAKCFICGFDFGKMYGEGAKEFIHVHHLKPLAEIGSEYTVDAVRDLRPVCPNCHAVLHMHAPPFSIEEVQKMLSQSAPSAMRPPLLKD